MADPLAQLAKLNAVLNARCEEHDRLEPYDDGDMPLPPAIVRARVTRAYRSLMSVSEAPWGSLVVDSVQDRLEIIGLEDGDQSAADRCWEVWQDNQMDAESTLAHRAALLDGRAFALVWRDPDTGEPAISLDDSTQMAVLYQNGSRSRRVAALRRWMEDGEQVYATLYRPDGIYKFSKASPTAERWDKRQVEGESWPLPNPLETVPVVELAVNRRLKAGPYGYARGEFAHCTGLIDRINLLTFLGLVVAFWMGFPFRAVIGDKILRDDDDNPLAPFEPMADSVGQFENPDTKFQEFAAADRKNLAVFPELDQLAVVTKTPRHYFPLEQGMSNLSADAIRASEGGLHAKVAGHTASLGEGWEEVLRLSGRLLDQPVDLSPRAAVQWADRESRSLAERADAASKLKDLLPWQALATMVLNATGDQISQWEAQRTSDGFGQLLAAAAAAAQPIPPAQPQVSFGGVPAGA